MDNQILPEDQASPSLAQSFNILGLPAYTAIAIVPDNAASLPNCMSKTMRHYLLKTFPDLAVVAEESRWESQPAVSSRIGTRSAPLRSLLPMAPQRQDSILSFSSCSTSGSSCSSSSSSKSSTGSLNRRSLLARQGSTMSLLVRQSSLRTVGGGVGLPRMPKRQDSVSFLF
ncbi:expressed unknown protein [Seminavis robusta]|uniref:Uncharacterized protein n=1 Tax=Seminavis robusta TaxID=568900 RepID=A0A9N8E1R9_9STRA|nr:expressed unknown protein [Seminavis robusta]|eukprot:Sro533_g161640.1 n/a (171) ;mRNA; r:29126-29638